MKKLALFLSLVMALSMTLTAGVAANPTTGTITINGSNNVTDLSDQEFKVYKIFDVVILENGGIAYTITDAFKDFKGYPTSATQSLAAYLRDQDDHSKWMDELGTALWEYINAGPIISPTAIKTGAIGETSVVFTDLTLGYYLVFGSGLTEDGKQVVSAVGLTTTEPDADVHLKADAPTIDKAVDNQHTGDWENWTDASIGDFVTFKLETKVPIMRGYEKYFMTVHDLLSDGLTFPDDVEDALDPAIGAFKVEIEIDNSLVELEEGVHYTLHIPGISNSINANESTFSVEFEDFLSDVMTDLEYTTGDRIIITYNALLNEDAVIGSVGNPNWVWLDYSNNPYDEDSHETTPEVEVRVFTGEFDILKYSVDDLGNDIFLAGAKFNLFEADEDGKMVSTPISLVKLQDGDAPGNSDTSIYRAALDGEAGTTLVIETPASGKVKIEGLGASHKAGASSPYDFYGDYFLEEIEAPEGYNMLDENPIKIRLAITINNTTPLTASWTVYKFAYDEILEDYFPVYDENNVHEIHDDGVVKIFNDAGPRFPETGGVGRTMIYVLGAAMLLGAGVLLMIRKRAAVIQRASR